LRTRLSGIFNLEANVIKIYYFTKKKGSRSEEEEEEEEDLSPMLYCINKLRDIMIVRKPLAQLNIPTRQW